MNDIYLITGHPEKNRIGSGTHNVRLKTILRKCGLMVLDAAHDRSGREFCCVLASEMSRKSLSSVARFFGQSGFLFLNKEFGLYRIKADLTNSTPLGILKEASGEEADYLIGNVFYKLMEPAA